MIVGRGRGNKGFEPVLSQFVNAGPAILPGRYILAPIPSFPGHKAVYQLQEQIGVRPPGDSLHILHHPLKVLAGFHDLFPLQVDDLGFVTIDDLFKQVPGQVGRPP